MKELKNIIQFYKDCYLTDLKGVIIRNFVSRQYEKRKLPDHNDLFHDNISGVPVDTKWAKEVEQSLYLNSKEKTLYAGSIFVRGSQNTIRG